MSAPLDWRYRVADVPEGGLRAQRTASEGERAALARPLEIVACESLVCSFRIRAIGAGRYRLTGDVTARLIQNCVVTLEALDQKLAAEFDVEFWPSGKLPEAGEEEIEALSAAEVEPIEHGEIDVGRIVFETLSAAVDPYPRKPGAELDAGLAAASASGGDAGPFAALKKLKDRD